VPGRALLDTSAVAALLRGDRTISDKLEALGEVYTSVVVIGELTYGARLSVNSAANIERVAAFSAAVTVLPADEGTSAVYARTKHALRSKGRPIPDNDLWIASTAIQYGLALLHRDSHFDEIEELAGMTW
jgi:tRNA(fMet)-specific endonuclease VapC